MSGKIGFTQGITCYDLRKVTETSSGPKQQTHYLKGSFSYRGIFLWNDRHEKLIAGSL